MGKFGKKNVVSTDLSKYMLGIIGAPGWGKSTLMYHACDKLYGEDGYMIFDMGMEDGLKAITGAMYESIPTYSVLNEVVTDIVKNKETDYPNLKVVVIDTLDAYFEVVEEYVIKDWNASNAGNQNFTKAKSINSVEGGFGRGMDRVIDTAKKIISRLNSVGVGVWWTAHIKEKDISDLFTGSTFTQLTANMSQKYFGAIKNSTDVIGCGYYDRSIEKIEVGDENPVTKKKKQRNTVIKESRKIKFRDDMLIADAKSRFADIVDEIPLDTDEFIKAISDAIKAAGAKKKDSSGPVVQKTEPVKKEEEIEDIFEPSDAIVEDKERELMDNATAAKFIKENFKGLLVETKAKIRDAKGDKGSLEELDNKVLNDLVDIVKTELNTTDIG